MFTSAKRKVRWAGVIATTAATLITTTGFASASAPELPHARVLTTPEERAEPCLDGWLCIWDETAGHGTRVDFYECVLEDVRDYGLSRVSSFVNNQYDGTVSTFQGPDESNPDGPWYEQYTSTAFEIREDTTDFLTYGVQVC